MLPDGRLPHRPAEARGPGADHARPFRPCARRPCPCAGDDGDARRDAPAPRHGCGRRAAGGQARRDDADRRRLRHLPSRRPLPRLGADLGRGERHAHRRDRRLQARARPDLPGVRARALRRADHRGDLRPAGLPPPAGEPRGAGASGFPRALPRAHPPRRRLCARQGAAGDRAPARGGLRSHDLPARRARGALRALRGARRRSGAARACDGAGRQGGRQGGRASCRARS